MRKIKRAVLIVLSVAVFLGMQAFPLPETFGADPDLDIRQGRADMAMPGSRNVFFDFTVTNNTGADFTYTGLKMVFSDSQDSQGITNIRTSEGETIGNGQTSTISFQLDVRDNARTGARMFQIAFELSSGDSVTAADFFQLFILEGAAEIPDPEKPSDTRTYRAAADFTHTLGAASGFSHGRENSITFQVHNRGDTTIRNAEFTIELPEGMSVYNASTTFYVGNISIGQRVGRTYSVMVYDDLAGGRAYPVTLKVTGIDRGNSAVNLERTFYIPVTGTGAGAVRDIVIENIAFPAEVRVDEDFVLEFSVRNTGASAIKNIKAYADIPETLLNKSNATFVIDSIGAGETQAFSITMSAREGSNRSQPVKIAVEPLSGAVGSEVIKYASVYVTGGGEAMMPQLIVDQYSYGGSSIMAGKEFFLNLGLFNTSGKELSNIKVTIISDDGTFVPVDSSNSFFVERIAAGGHYSKSLRLSAKPSAEQKTTGITVRMSYESGSGTYTADDTISIPVMQAMRLTVDEIVPPYECYAGMPGSSAVQFYNMGKTTLNNLVINAEGNFDLMESNSYYVGNMEGGYSDSYSFIFIPREPGIMEGKVVFTYENIDGDPIVHEVPFAFTVMEAPVWDEYIPDYYQESRTPWALIIFGIVLVLAAAGVVVWRKKRKAKLSKMLEIQELLDE